MPTVTNNTAAAHVTISYPTPLKVKVDALFTSPCQVIAHARSGFGVIFPGQSKTFTERVGESLMVTLTDGDAVETTGPQS